MGGEGMVQWISAHCGDILVLAILGVVIGRILLRLIRGKNSRGCCGSCQGCSCAGACQEERTSG